NERAPASRPAVPPPAVGPGRAAPSRSGTEGTMKRIGILTAGGDTPALNATIAGAVERANQLRIEVFGIIKGYGGLLNPEVPHVHLNPLFQSIPELDAARGGTILGASRDYVSADDRATLERVV